MVDHSDLQESSVVGVMGAILVFVSLMTVYSIYNQASHWIYPAAQQFLIFLFVMPLLIGWVAWVEIINTTASVWLEFLVNLFKAICCGCFIEYSKRMLGRIRVSEKNKYSKDRSYEILTTKGEPKRFFCVKFFALQNEEESRRFLKITAILVYQLCFVLIILGIIGLIVVVTTGDFTFSDTRENNILFILGIIKAVSSIISIVGLMRFGIYVQTLDSMKKYQIFHKLIIIKLTIIFTDVQPLIIKIFATTGAIVDKTSYTTEEITSYTNALLLCAEMGICCILVFIIFPISDFEHSEPSKITPDVNQITSKLK
jgi:Organic solute transporter Ostalpha